MFILFVLAIGGRGKMSVFCIRIYALFIPNLNIMTNSTTTNDNKPTIVIMKSLKSPGISILLTLLFGSIGMFYSTISGGLIMTFIMPPIMVYLLFTANWIPFFFLLLIYYPTCTIWGYRATKQYNEKLLNGIDTTEKIDLNIGLIIEGILIFSFFSCFLFAIVTLLFK